VGAHGTSRFHGNSSVVGQGSFAGTDDPHWQSDWRAGLSRGVVFRREPKEETYGTIAVFEDLYGNLWDLLQLK
jgi:hypothetical protein